MLDIKSVWGVMTHGLCWKWWENEYSILEIVLKYLAWNESFCLNNGIETSTLEVFGERKLSLKWQRRNCCSSVNGWHWPEIINLYLFNVLQLLTLLNEIIVKIGQSGEWWMKFFFVGNYYFFFLKICFEFTYTPPYYNWWWRKQLYYDSVAGVEAILAGKKKYHVQK